MAHTMDGDGVALAGCQVFVEIRDSAGEVVASVQGFSESDGNAVMTWRIPRQQPAGEYSANVVNVIMSGYEFNIDGSVTLAAFTIE